MSQPPLLWEHVRPLWPVRLQSGHWAWGNLVMRRKRHDGRGYVYAFIGHYWVEEE